MPAPLVTLVTNYSYDMVGFIFARPPLTTFAKRWALLKVFHHSKPSVWGGKGQTIVHPLNVAVSGGIKGPTVTTARVRGTLSSFHPIWLPVRLFLLTNQSSNPPINLPTNQITTNQTIYQCPTNQQLVWFNLEQVRAQNWYISTYIKIGKYQHIKDIQIGNWAKPRAILLPKTTPPCIPQSI